MPEKVLYDEVHSERGMYECIIYSFLTFPVSFGPGKAVACRLLHTPQDNAFLPLVTKKASQHSAH